MGNRLTKTSDGAATGYTYNSLNQLTGETGITYTYNANGSQTLEDGAAKTAAYTYDQQGRLIGVVVTAGGTTTTETYQYNWSGIRTSKTTNGVKTKYLIDPNGSLSQVIAELDSAGNLLAYYTRGAELISLHRTGETGTGGAGTGTGTSGTNAAETHYYQYDPNGSVRLLTNGTGAITDTYTYDAFGNLLAQTGTTENSYLYNGQQYDANTGFYYLRARYMNPSTGTFISMDPAQGSIFDPVSLHKYLYANANPVMNSDPSGRETLAEMGAAIGMQAAIGAIVGGSMEASMRVLAYLTSGNEVDAGNLVFEFFDGFMQGAIIGGVFGALFGAFGAIAAESILANCVLRSAFLTMGLANSFDGIKGILDGDYWGGSLKIVEGILWGLGVLPNYYRGGIENSTYSITAEDVATGDLSYNKPGPKPAGTGAHNQKIAEVASQVKDGEIIAGGGQKPERLIITDGGFKSGRRPDILVRRPDGTLYGINVGKTATSGAPITREAQAISDLEGAGLPMHFVPYY